MVSVIRFSQLSLIFLLWPEAYIHHGYELYQICQEEGGNLQLEMLPKCLVQLQVDKGNLTNVSAGVCIHLKSSMYTFDPVWISDDPK